MPAGVGTGAQPRRRGVTAGVVPHLDRPTKTGLDYRITDRDALGQGSESEKIEPNLEAITPLKAVDAATWLRFVIVLAATEHCLFELDNMAGALQAGIPPESDDLARARGALAALMAEYARLREGMTAALDAALFGLPCGAVQ